MDAAGIAELAAAIVGPGHVLVGDAIPDDYTHDVPSVSLLNLVQRAEAVGVVPKFTDVLGKA